MRNEEKAVIGVDKKERKTIETKQNMAFPVPENLADGHVEQHQK